MSEMIDLGSSPGGGIKETPLRKKYYPSITLTAKQVKGLKIDQKLNLSIKARVVSMRSNRNDVDRFEIELEQAKVVKGNDNAG